MDKKDITTSLVRQNKKIAKENKKKTMYLNNVLLYMYS